jgi:membrane protein DedA with SNARE-associated domain
VVSTAAGYLLGVSQGTLVGWSGMTLGCLLGYAIGSYGGRPVTRRFVGDSELERAAGAHSRHGDWGLIALRSVPVLAEASVILAGIVRMPFRRFVALTCLSNLGISAAYAAVGAYAVRVESFLLAFAGAIVIPAVAIFVARWRT